MTVVNPSGGDPLTRDDCYEDIEENLPHAQFYDYNSLELNWNISGYTPSEQDLDELDRVVKVYYNFF